MHLPANAPGAWVYNAIYDTYHGLCEVVVHWLADGGIQHCGPQQLSRQGGSDDYVHESAISTHCEPPR